MTARRPTDEHGGLRAVFGDGEITKSIGFDRRDWGARRKSGPTIDSSTDAPIDRCRFSGFFFDGSEPNRHNQGALSPLDHVPVHTIFDRPAAAPRRRGKPSHRGPVLTPSERLELSRLASLDSPDENLQLRARIVLSWAAGATGDQSARLLATSRRTISKWRCRFRDGGIDALLDRPRRGAPRSIARAKIAEVLRLQSSPPPAGRSRWTSRLLAKHTGLSQSTVVRIVRDHRRAWDCDSVLG